MSLWARQDPETLPVTIAPPEKLKRALLEVLHALRLQHGRNLSQPRYLSKEST